MLVEYQSHINLYLLSNIQSILHHPYITRTSAIHLHHHYINIAQKQSLHPLPNTLPETAKNGLIFLSITVHSHLTSTLHLLTLLQHLLILIFLLHLDLQLLLYLLYHCPIHLYQLFLLLYHHCHFSVLSNLFLHLSVQFFYLSYYEGTYDHAC